jgi:FMN phosphatase YigB (HAD superfamily)
MIKAIIFDRHGVFDRITGESLRQKIASHTDYDTPDTIKEKIQEPRTQYDMWIIQPTDFRSIVQDTFHFTEEQTQDCRNYLNTIQPIQELRDIIPSLQKHYTLGILSDCPKDKKEMILKQYNMQPFTYQFRSCDYTKTKAQWLDFFEIMYMYLKENNVIKKPEEILFVDDTLSNVQKAQSLDMMACHFHDVNDLKKFIHRE